MRRLGFLIVLLMVLASCTSPSASTLPGDPVRSGYVDGHHDGHHGIRHIGAGSHGRAGTGDGRRWHRRRRRRGSPFEPLPAGITVKDAYTSVMVQVTNPPTFPFPVRRLVPRGLQPRAPERFPGPGNHPQLEVVDAAGPPRSIASFAGKQLVDPTCAFGNCNRLRACPSRR